MADLSAQLQHQVIAARTDRRPLTIVGGNTKAFMGRSPVEEHTRLDLSGHTGILTYHPVELVLTARAGTRLTELEAALAEQNQMLSFEPPRFGPEATIGGTLACNQSGPGRPWWSSIRDQVLGIRMINGRGEHLHFGGQVMKNVAGYDVSRLQAGAMGTLGVMTEVSLKVLPKPAASRTLKLAVSADEAIGIMNRRALESRPLTAACWYQGHLYLRLSGALSAVEATLARWEGEVDDAGDAFWQQLRDQQLSLFDGEAPLWRFSVSPSAPLADLEGEWVLDWGGAQRWYRGEADKARMEAIAAAAGGQVSLYRGGDRQQEVMHALPPALQQLQLRLKEAFDPDHLFNPGRVYSWM
ncbi:glycolate oxidase subunit GlcE [Marinobacterium sp. AK62]|uniref:Glycolate oxidase subunit GlcE n=1 Tax=Marinobacterium alkalitolerans TaxID=1542925 RepID=A0ABS3ZAC5_9GAMM|nr:glycolate oxidase subunit GlcE [Marinobacterium alkalitolerans]MBP0048586.1 glycolate oxidase subunit GlcE [Marinobacterium alkalitolerans]